MIAVASDRGRVAGASRRSALIREPIGPDDTPPTCGVDDRTRGADELTWGDLICAAPLSPVVSLHETAQIIQEATQCGASGETDSPANPLPERLTAAIDGVVRSYVSGEQDSRRALSSVLGSLAGETGRGFLINGLHGSGKSHLLCVLALLSAVPEAWTSFIGSHPEYEALSHRFRSGPILAVTVSLEAHRAGCEDLEDIVFAAAEAALERFEEGQSSCLSAAAFALSLAETHLLPLYQDQFGGWLEDRCGGLGEWRSLGRNDPAAAAGLAQEFSREAGIPLEWHEPRRERLRRLLEISRRCGQRGVVILLDEVSLYLAGKPREQFYGDVSFLQFLGQQSAYFPLWIVGAVQRGLEETGDIDAETLRKLKDRYVWDLSLSMAQICQVLRERVVHRKDGPGFAALIRHLRESRTGSHGGGNGSLERDASDELTECYPLDPLALECLAAASGRFFSKTRSVVEFVQHVVREGSRRKASDLVGPDEVFVRFWPAAADYPELAPAAAAYRHYRQNISKTVPDDPEYALRLLGVLAALSLAGIRRTVQEVVVSLGPAGCTKRGPVEPPECCSVPGAGERVERSAVPQGLPSVMRAHDILERLRHDEGYVDVARGASPGDDVYFLDPAYDVARIVRRRIAVCSGGIQAGDSRVREAAYLAADAALPLSSLGRGVQVEVEWLTARHSVSIARRDLRQWSAAEASAEIDWLCDPRQPETLRLFVGELCDPQAQRHGFLQALRQTPESRWRIGITAWLPRGLRPEEQHLLRNYAAFRLVIEDPTLRLTAIGRQVLEKLRAEQPERDRTARDVVLSAYSGGELIGAEGILATSADLCRRALSLE
ncbi:MAG: DUF6079 family protein, partial [Chloroflexi bacterium]|nr:DUF6079 family protein [Chloroflexota bacterium]